MECPEVTGSVLLIGELVLPVLAIVEVSLKYHSDLPRMFLMKVKSSLGSTAEVSKVQFTMSV